MIYACQRCDREHPECTCPTFKGEERMECTRCKALQGQHLVDFTSHPDASERLICPGPLAKPETRVCPECGEAFTGYWDEEAHCYFDQAVLERVT